MTTERTILRNLLGIGGAAFCAAVGVVIWRTSTPAGTPGTPSSGEGFVSGTFDVLAASAGIAVIAVVTGIAASLALPVAVRERLGLAVLAGLGIGVLGATATAEWLVAGRISAAPKLTILVALLAIVIVTVIRGWRRGWRAVGVSARTVVRTWGRSLDLVAMAVAFAALLPVARLGLTAFAGRTYDWHRYASSAMIAMDGEESFTARFGADYLTFGEQAIWRSRFEKPVMTAIVATFSDLTGLHPVQLLAPLLIVFLAVMIGAVAAIVARGFLLRSWALLCVIGPALSVSVLSRVFDSQLGGLAASALVAVALALVLQFDRVRTVRRTVPLAIAVGVVAATAFGCHMTVALTACSVIGLVAAWLIVRRAHHIRVHLVGLAIAAGVGVVLLVPLASRLWHSLSTQTATNEVFPQIPLVTAAAAIGVEPFAVSITVASAAATWVVAFTVGIAIAARRWRTSPDARWALVVIAVVGVISLYFGMHHGAEDYITGKWFSIAIPLAVPVLIGAALAAWPTRRAQAPLVVLVGGGVAAIALIFAAEAGYKVPLITPASAASLGDSATVSDEAVINVDVDDIQNASIVPLFLESDQVRVLDSTYVPGASPIGSTFLIQDDAVWDRHWLGIEHVVPGFNLVTLDLSSPGEEDFMGDPLAGDHLFGPWNSRKPADTVLVQHLQNGEGFLVVDLDKPAGAERLRVIVEATSVGTTPQAPPGTLRARVGDVEQSGTAEYGQPIRLVLDLPADAVGPDGRLAVGLLATADPQTGIRLDRAQFEWDQ